MDEGRVKKGNRYSVTGDQKTVTGNQEMVIRKRYPVTSNQKTLMSNRILVLEDYTSLVEERAISVEPWVVVRTKVKCEKFIRDRLKLMGLEAFVPLRKRTAKYNRKVKVYELPLITGYAFVRLDKTRRNEVLALPYVQGMLRTAGHDCIVSDREIQWLQKISGTDIEVRTETLSMKQGDRVVLASGQLAGMEGVIISQRSKHEMVVALESIGMQMVVQVDASMLELAW